MTHKHLPKDWQIKKLGEVCFYSKGKKPKMLTGEKTGNAKLPYINIKAFEKGVFDEYTDGYKCNLCEDNEILMVWDGARAGFVGKAKKGAIGSTLMKISPKENIDKDYIFYYLKSIFKKINTNPRGVGIPHVEPNLLWNSEINIPNLPTQQSIVARIEQLFSELDQAVANLKTAQAQLKTYRQSVLKWAFEGRLTRTDIQDGVLPEGWEWKKLGEICKTTSGGTPSRKIKEYFSGNIPWVKSGELNQGIIKDTEEKISKEALENSSAKIFPKGTLLIALYGATIGKLAFLGVEASTNQAVCGIFESEKIVSKFLYYLLLFNKPKLIQQGIGGAQPNISQTILKDLVLTIPALTEQHSIVQAIETRLSVADQLEENIKTALQKAEVLRQSILKKAFSGEWE